MTEHWVGVTMAPGYDADDFKELADRVAWDKRVGAMEVRSVEPDTPRGAVDLLRESRRYVAGHAFTQPVGDSVAAALLARIDAALGERQ